MPMEQEMMGLLIRGFSIIMGISFIVVLLLLFSKKRKSYRLPYGFVLGSFIFFSWALIKAFEALRFDASHPMASEEISLLLGVAGVLWAISMLLLLVGLVCFSAMNKSQ